MGSSPNGGFPPWGVPLMGDPPLGGVRSDMRDRSAGRGAKAKGDYSTHTTASKVRTRSCGIPRPGRRSAGRAEPSGPGNKQNSKDKLIFISIRLQFREHF